jgi:hypothetical protein
MKGLPTKTAWEDCGSVPADLLTVSKNFAEIPLEAAIEQCAEAGKELANDRPRTDLLAHRHQGLCQGVVAIRNNS